MTGIGAGLPGYVAEGVVMGGADVRCGDYPAFDDGMMAGWVRARVRMLRDVQSGRMTVQKYRETIAVARDRWGDEINRRVNDLAVAALARQEGT